MIKVLTLAGAFMLTSMCVSAQNNPESLLPDSTADLVYDFGTITKDAPVAKIFKVYNNGNRPVRIRTIWASPYCTVPVWSNKPIKPGKFGLMKVIYNGEKAGPFEANLKVVYYDREALKGEGITENILVKGRIND